MLSATKLNGEYCRFVRVALFKRYRNSLVLLPLVGLVLFFLLTSFLFYINYSHFSIELLRFYGSTEAIFFLVQILLLLYLNYFIILGTEKIFSRRLSLRLRFVTEAFLVIIFSFLILLVLRQFFVYWRKIGSDDQLSLERIRRAQSITLFLSLLVYGGMIITRYFVSLRKKQFEFSRWEHNLTQAQLDALKNRLNPDLLFNSLSALSGLVRKNPSEAESYIGKLSRTYRYLLEHRKETGVPLQAELQFLEQYRYLINHRFGEKIVFSIENLQRNIGQLVPNTLLIVMEFIIHSCSMSSEQPLRISLSTDGLNVLVTYNHSPKKIIGQASNQQFEALRQHYISLKRQIILESDTTTGLSHIIIPLLFP